jgi:glycosyltransferase involved in cell wall biosynthesis
MKAAVIIVTKNRQPDLRCAIASALEQTAISEVLVIDDGSTDGTSDMVRSEFPEARLERSVHSLGYIAQRNRAARLTSADLIVSIDDDAVFSSFRVVEQAVAAFGHPRIAALAIPYIEPHKTMQQRQTAPDSRGIWVTDFFRGTAHALRRDIFLDLGGYREHLVHQGEELDFCIRLLERGLIVRLGHCDHITHYEAQTRDRSRMDYYGRRNDILFVWHNVPPMFVPPHLVGTTINGARCAFAAKSAAMVRGTLSGYAAIGRMWSKRDAVSASVYRLHRNLKKHGPRLLSDIEPLLPPISVNSSPRPNPITSA